MQALRAEDPRQVGSYQLLGRLGEGGMGQVFLGEDILWTIGPVQVSVKLAGIAVTMTHTQLTTA